MVDCCSPCGPIVDWLDKWESGLHSDFESNAVPVGLREGKGIFADTLHFWWIVSSPMNHLYKWEMVDCLQMQWCVSALVLRGLSADGFHSSCNKWGLNRHKIPGEGIKLPCTMEGNQHLGSLLQVFCIKMKNCPDKKNINTLCWPKQQSNHTHWCFPSSRWCWITATRWSGFSTDDWKIISITIKLQI